MTKVIGIAAAISSSGTGGGLAAGAMFFVFLLIGIAAFVFWLWMLIDLLKSSKPTNEKILWAIVMLVLGVLGSLIYLLVARNKSVA